MKFNFRIGNRFALSLTTAFILGLLTSAAAFSRQILVAGYFGVGGDMDAYVMTFAIASFIAFAPGAVFQHAAVPSLVQTLEQGGEREFAKLAGSLFTLSLAFSVCIGLVFLALSPLAIHLFAPGFDSGKKAAVASIAMYFLPWVLLSAPYNALGAILKSNKTYVAPLGAELLLTLVSLGFLVRWHSDVRDIAIAYFAGHLAACICLICIVIKGNVIRIGLRANGMRRITRNIAELYGSMQLGGVAGIVERIYQSYLPSGGISALSYANQLSNAISGLLGFKQIYVVPLSGEKNRTEKLERLLTGLIFLTMPIALFFSFFAGPIVECFYRRGKFDEVAVENTAGLLAILAFGILSSTINAPLARMYQVIDKIRLSTVIQTLAIFNFLVFGYFFQFILHLGVKGLALAIILNSFMAILIQIWLLRKSGLALDLARMGRVVLQAVAANAAVLLILKTVFADPKGEMAEFLALTAAWGIMTLAAYSLNWRTLKWALKSA